MPCQELQSRDITVRAQPGARSNWLSLGISTSPRKLKRVHITTSTTRGRRRSAQCMQRYQAERDRIPCHRGCTPAPNIQGRRPAPRFARQQNGSSQTVYGSSCGRGALENICRTAHRSTTMRARKHRMGGHEGASLARETPKRRSSAAGVLAAPTNRCGGRAGGRYCSMGCF